MRKTISSLRRNVTTPIVPILESLGFSVKEKLSQNVLEIEKGSIKNRFYLFGGRDESSAALIQGMTLGGVLFDEVALMPRSFVEQAIARCSLEGSKFWFNCNPEHPFHWFYNEWIKRPMKRICSISILQWATIPLFLKNQMSIRTVVYGCILSAFYRGQVGSRRRLGLSDVFYGKECKACGEFQRVLFILRLRHRQSLFARIMGKRRGWMVQDKGILSLVP